MSTFTKQTSGRIIFEDNDGKLHSFAPFMSILPHPSDESIALISPYASGQQVTDESLVFDWSLVTIPAGITTRNELITALNGEFFNGDGTVSEDNSSETPLGAGATFPGAAIDITGCGIIFVNVYSDVASATDGLVIYQSKNGTNWDHDDKYTVPAGSGKNYAINPFAQFLKVVYTNGGSIQTAFRLQTVCKANSLPSSHRIQDPIVDEDDARLVKSVLSAKFNGGGFGNVTATASGNLRVTDAESGLAIAKGDVANTGFVHKFGNAPDFDTADGDVTVWDGADDGTAWENMVYDYSITADIDSISSENNSDTQDLEIQGLDTNYNIVTQTITLTGQARKALNTSLIRVFRMKNVGSSNTAGHVFCYVNGAITLGVPDDASTIRAIIQPGNNQTLMAVYTVPAGVTGYMRDWYASISGANKSSNYTVKILARPFGGVFQLKHISALADTGTSAYQHLYEEPEIFPQKTDIEIKVSSASVGTTAASFSAGFDIVLVNN